MSRFLCLIAALALPAGCAHIDAHDDGPPWWVNAGEDHPSHVLALGPGGLGVSVVPANDYVLVTGPDGQVWVQIVIAAPASVERVERPPINLALAIDRSGSMQGVKLDQAKAAAIAMLDELGPDDKVALMSYASDVTLEVPAVWLDDAGRDHLVVAISQLEANGGTDLAGGLDVGGDALLDTASAGDLSRVILLSDGRPTVGETAPWALEAAAARLREDGVVLTTMGVGVDYNEELMANMALAGGGAYYYVPTPETLADTLQREVRSVSSTLFEDVEVELILPDNVRLREVYGYRHQQRGQRVGVVVGALAAGERRRILLSLDTDHTPVDVLPVVSSARARYRPTDTEGGSAGQSMEVPGLAVRTTRDRRTFARGWRADVVEKVEGIRNAEAKREAFKHLDRGDRAAARRVVKERREEASRSYSGLANGVHSDGRDAADHRVTAAAARGRAEMVDFEADVEATPKAATPAYKAMRKRHHEVSDHALRY